jgi:cytochrome c biogenesis protein CcdA
MIAAIDSNVLGLAFLRGMVASINPCGFVLLPTYLLYFLGIQAAERTSDQRASMRRALVVGSAVAAGFVAVFLVVGVITETIDTWLLSNARYATVVIGTVFVALGIAMLAGYRPRFATPHLDAGGRTRSVGSMFVYGIAYAVASSRTPSPRWAARCRCSSSRCSAPAAVRASPPASPTPCSTAPAWASSSSP